MSETTTETTTNTDAGDGAAAGGDQGKTFTQADVDRVVEQRLTRERAKFGDYDALKQKAAKFDELDAANKSEMERLQEQLAAEQTARTTAETKAAAAERTQFGIDKGLPSALAKKLTGQTPEELEAEIEELRPFIGGAPKSDEKKKLTIEALRSGASDFGSASTDPKERAAEAVRALRSVDQ